MQVALESLEPGSIVQTPKALTAVGFKAKEVVYAGTEANGFPAFWALNPLDSANWYRYNWPTAPRSYNEYSRLADLPAGFEVVKSEPTAQAFKKFASTLHGVGGIPSHASGCDPELFLLDSKGKVIPARRVLQAKSTGAARFFDGIQAEFCTPPNGCLEGLSTSIRSQLSLMLSDFRAKHKDAKFSLKNSIQLTQKEMDALEDEDVVFRCSSSSNVYNDVPGTPEPREYLWRFAGGHIHVGTGTKPKPVPVLRNMVRAMDAVLGVAGVSLARHWDTPERRKFYGRAGEFRVPAHGLEYRVLSNYWLCSPLIYHLTFEIARWAYKLGETGVFNVVWVGSEDETRDCINNCDVELAQKIIKNNSGVYLKLFEHKWSSYDRCITKAMDTLMNGLEVVVKDPEDIPRNWLFGDSGWGAYGGDLTNSKWRYLRC